MNITIDDIIDYSFNPPPSAEMLEHRVVEKVDDDSTIMYQRFTMPMMSDRDALFQMSKKKMPDGSSFMMLKSISRDDIPERPGTVRMFMFVRCILSVSKEKPDTVDADECSTYNMNGYFPARLMNMVTASETQRECGAMYKYIQDKKKK
jgi:hypothetical protein